jgi:hypothetical protein
LDAAGPAEPGRERELASLLRSQTDRFEAALESIRKRIEDLAGGTKPE